MDPDALAATQPSVIAPLDKPSLWVAIQPVERAIGKRDVPFVALPGIGSPPVSRSAPRAGEFDYPAANALGGHETWLAGSKRYPRSSGWTEKPESQF